MRNLCGKIVNILGNIPGKTRVRLSPNSHPNHVISWPSRVQPPFIHTTFPRFSQLISPRLVADLPPSEHYLYPVSTAPTNSHNQRKLKKGNK
jgi:hypothetical protein